MTGQPSRLHCLADVVAALASERDVRVRHEGVAETVLLFAKEVTTPAVLPAVCYRGVPPPATGRCEALGTTYPHPSGWQPRREPKLRLPAPGRSGTRRAW